MDNSTLLPPGFLGSRGDILMDIVVLSFALILPALMYSGYLAHSKHYAAHKRWQLSIFVVLLVAVGLFEADMLLSGGIFTLTAASSYAGTLLLNSLIYSHMVIAISAALLWVVMIAVSLKYFDNPPAPNHFSSTHRRWGRVAMLSMMLSGLTSIPVYYVGFVL